MTSKTRLTGSAAVARVQEAAAKACLNVYELFAHVENAKGTETQQLRDLANCHAREFLAAVNGSRENPKPYEVPRAALWFAEVLLRQRCALAFVQTLPALPDRNSLKKAA